MNHWLTSTVKAYTSHFGKTSVPVIWEVGSRDGHDAVELAERISSRHATPQITCLEPNPPQAQLIRQTYPQVRVLELAASDRAGHQRFIAYEGDEGMVGSSSLNLEWKDNKTTPHTIITVVTERLDELLGDEEVDIMKIDVEGYSLQVLRGLGKRINQVKVMHIETEQWTGSDLKVKAYMAKRGWRLVDEAEQYGGMPDLVFINANLLD